MWSITAGLLLGLAGGAHCLAMCGPFVVLGGGTAGSAGGSGRRGRWSHAWLLHHAGRLTTYLALGAVAGISGHAVADAGWRSGLAIAAGVVLIGQAVVRGTRHPFDRFARASAAITRLLTIAMRSMPAAPARRALALGAINGLLPCGLLYGALSAAAGLGDVAEAIKFMLAFGLGTLPVLGVLAYAAQTVVPRIGWSGRLVPVALAVVGLLLVARGVGTVPFAHGAALHAAHGLH